MCMRGLFHELRHPWKSLINFRLFELILDIFCKIFVEKKVKSDENEFVNVLPK